MERRQENQNPSPQRIDDYLRRFQAGNVESAATQADSDMTLDQYLLERTAQSLRAAHSRPPAGAQLKK